MQVIPEVKIIAQRLAEYYTGSDIAYARYLEVAVDIYAHLNNRFCKCD